MAPLEEIFCNPPARAEQGSGLPGRFEMRCLQPKNFHDQVAYSTSAWAPPPARMQSSLQSGRYGLRCAETFWQHIDDTRLASQHRVDVRFVKRHRHDDAAC